MPHLFNFILKNNYPLLVVHVTEKSIWIFHLELTNDLYFVSWFRRFHLSSSVNYLSLVHKKIKHYNLNRKHAALVIADSYTARNYIKVSKKLNDAELDELVRIEAKNYSAINSTNVCFDYFVFDDKQSEHYKIVIVFAKTHLIAKQIKFLNSFGLKVKLVDIESNCVVRIVNGLLCGIVSNLEMGDSNVGGFRSRKHGAGGRDSHYYKTKIRQNVLWIDIRENIIKVFVIKEGIFFALYEDSYLGSNVVVNTATLLAITNKIMHIIVERDLNFIEKIYLSGLFRQLDALCDILASQNSIPVIIFDSVQLLGIKGKDISLLPKLAVDSSCAQTRSAEPECTLVHEESSIELTKQIEYTVEFSKQAIINQRMRNAAIALGVAL